MNPIKCTLARAAIGVTVSFAGAPAFAQGVDLSGQWQQMAHMDARTRGPGPDLADYLGIPLNDEGRAVALSYSYTMVSMTERMCMHNSQNLITNDAPSILIERVNDPVTGVVTAWRISSGGSVRSPLIIWMDGREQPPDHELHTFNGIARGEWNGPVLRGYVTHMKYGASARNGAPLSDRMTMTIHLVRHGDLLTILTVTEDPIYLEAPFPQAATFQLNPGGNVAPVNAPCYPLTEVPTLDAPGTVPHYLPGTNPYADDFATRWNLPLDAAHGGAHTMFPEYRKKLKDTYTPPPPCRELDARSHDYIVGQF